MEFFAPNGIRPVRLCEQTRQFAWDSIHHRYGKDTTNTPGVSMDEYEGFEALTPLQKYDAAIRKIAECAPLRICDGEKVSGAATLGLGITEDIPATYHGKKVLPGANSHLTLDFETVVKKGIKAIKAQAVAALERYRGTEKEPFAQSCVHCLHSMEIWRQRYLAALKELPGYEENYRNLLRVPFEPASTFHEAVQSIWFTFAFTRLCGNWPGIGRLDWLLGEYLERDLAENTMTVEEAREILAHFFIKGCEWIRGGDYGSGDAQHYQNILLAGVDENGKEVTNTVTYLVLDVLEELGISDFPTTVRVNRNTDPRLLRRVAEVIRLGGGVVAVYNEDLIIDSLVTYGYPLTEARKFANDGCWEVQIPGKTYFMYTPFDGLQILQNKTLGQYRSGVSFPDFETLYQCYVADLKAAVQQLYAGEFAGHFVSTELPVAQWRWKRMRPCTVVSLFEQGCIEKGLSYLEGGPVYNLLSPHIGGLPDIVNSLYAIRELVFRQKKVAFSDLMEILQNNWEGHEPLRQYALNKLAHYGNDEDEVDALAVRLIEDFAEICDGIQGAFRTPAGISTFGRQLEWSKSRLATPYGKRNGDVLAGNCSPTPGTDREGATAIIRSYCKANLKRMVSGAALDIKLLPSAIKGENGVGAIVALIRGLVTLGGHFMQLDIADSAMLKEAQAHPEDYQSLSVRVSGWNARFVTLNKEWQDMIIAQTGSEL